MDTRIVLEPMSETMRVMIRVPSLPDQAFSLVVPESVGYVGGLVLNFPGQKPIWTEQDENGAIGYTLENENVVYTVRLVPSADEVTVIESIKNKADRIWEHAFTFSCFSTNGAPRFADTKFDRTFLLMPDGLTSIEQIDRTVSERPLLQFYYIQGKRYTKHGFMDNFQATSPILAAESCVFTVSEDGKAVVGTATSDAAFLFNNGEFSCIHACPDFGTIYPGETRMAVTRLYFLQGDAATFQKRYHEDFRARISLRPLARRPKPPKRQGVEITPLPWDTWDTRGRLTLRFPETLHSNLGLLFIDHRRSDMPPVVDLQELPDWRLDPYTGALSYECKLPNKVEFAGSITPGADALDMKFTVRNGTDAELKRLNMQFCLVETLCPDFNIPELINTYILHEGKWLALSDSTFEKMSPDEHPWVIGSVKGVSGPKPGASHPDAWYVCHEPADAPLIATVSKDGAHVLAIAWQNGRSVMSNGMIPCLHADPVLPNCPPGESVSVEGKLYLLTGNLDDLKARYERDFD